MREWLEMVASYRTSRDPIPTSGLDRDRISRISSKLHQAWLLDPEATLCGLICKLLNVPIGAFADDRIEAALDARLRKDAPRSDAASTRVPLPRLAGMRAGPIVGESGDAATPADPTERQQEDLAGN